MKFNVQRGNAAGSKSSPSGSGKNRSKVKDEYVGCKVDDPDFELRTVRIEDLKPQEFWRDCVSQRKPVLIKGHPLESDWRASALWTNEYLIKHVGSSELLIEVRDGSQDRFGKGRKVKMSFEQFLRQLEGGSTKHYMSTQPCGKDQDGFPKLFVAPASGLQQDFPLRPELMGHLVPQQINMWMGAATDGSTSGLHHDFHDNLYVLLRGAKRFRLYDPSQASRMYTCGQLQRIHPNGRIVYQGQGEVRADGVEQNEVLRWEKMRAAEAKLAAAMKRAEAADEGSMSEAAKQLAAAERDLEIALEDALDDADLDMDDFEDDFDGEDSGVAKGDVEPEAEDPPSFSRIDLRADDKVLKKHWPDFPGKAAATTVTMEAGDMLYLPAGWFHEVTSFGSPKLGGHLALNYWFYPPNNLDPSLQGYHKPYTSAYLPSMWRQRYPQLHNATEEDDIPEEDDIAEEDDIPDSQPGLNTAPSSTQRAQVDTHEEGSAGEKKQQKKKKRKAEEAAIEQDDEGDDDEGDKEDEEEEPQNGGLDLRGALAQILKDRPDAASQLLQVLFGQKKKKKRSKPVWWWRGRRHHVAVYVPRDTPAAAAETAAAGNSE